MDDGSAQMQPPAQPEEQGQPSSLSGGGLPGASSTGEAPPSAPAAPSGPLIDELAAAVVSTARGVRGRWFFVGWTREGLPAATTTVDDLSELARKDLATFRGARLSPRKVPFATLIPVSYVMTGAAIDFADSRDRRAEDQVNYTVVDAKGARRDLAVGELASLGAIDAAREPWQSHQRNAASELAVEAIPIYTLFTTLPGVRADTGLVLMFDPTIPGSSNEPAFRSFVRNTIGRLLVLDESQPPAARKGYLHVAGRVAGVEPKGGILGSMVRLRKMGFVDFEDSWLRRQQGRGRKMKGGFLRTLRGMGMVEISDELLAELSDNRPDYDVDKLSLERLVDMAEQMHGVARKVLTPPEPKQESKSNSRSRATTRAEARARSRAKRRRDD
jgi:hypothetical protein